MLDLESENFLEKYEKSLDRAVPIKTIGRISDIVGLSIESIGPFASVGDVCFIETKNGSETNYIKGEVVGFKNKKNSHNATWGC